MTLSNIWYKHHMTKLQADEMHCGSLVNLTELNRIAKLKKNHD